MRGKINIRERIGKRPLSVGKGRFGRLYCPEE